MTTIVKTNFTAGELSYQMLGRCDLTAYENGALYLRNVFISPMGGVKRRAGLRYVDTLEGKARLISFAFNTEQTYLFVILNQKALVYKNGTKVAEITTPWLEKDLAEIRWTQSADTLLIAHKNYPLQKITRSSDTVWNIENWSFYAKDGYIYQPFYKFAGANVTLSLSALSGNITITASSPVFLTSHVGIRLQIGIGQVEIKAYTSPTEVSAEVKTPSLFKTAPTNNTTTDWKEQAFSAIRGYPVAVTFHQDRLVIGGSRDLPNRLWFSQSSDMADFNLGEGLDDEAIEFGLLSDQVNAIKALFSGRHLQVFTSGAEWMVSGEPLTPSNIQLKRQTRIGSPNYAYVPPRNVDGATLFCGAGNTGIREFLFSDLEQAYQSEDLSLLSRHLMDNPIDEDYEPNSRILFVVMMDGSLCTLTNYRTEQVSAWSRHETDGDFVSVAVEDEIVYVVVKRDSAYLLEVFDSEISMDCAFSQVSENAKTLWGGFSLLAGKEVNIIADGLLVEPQSVSQSGEIELNYPAQNVLVGLGFTHKIVPLPPATFSNAKRANVFTRLIRAIFRVIDTNVMEVDVGLGLQNVLPQKINGTEGFSVNKQNVTKDIVLRGIGWKREPLSPLWRVESSLPLPFFLLAVTTEIKESE